MKSIVIVGRPNVGKSSLFNRLTKTRDAIVADMPGLTRDRHYGKLEIQDSQFLLVDTGGFEPKNKEGIVQEMALQTKQAIDESDIIIFMVDSRKGLHTTDEQCPLYFLAQSLLYQLVRIDYLEFLTFHNAYLLSDLAYQLQLHPEFSLND